MKCYYVVVLIVYRALILQPANSERESLERSLNVFNKAAT